MTSPTAIQFLSTPSFKDNLRQGSQYYPFHTYTDGASYCGTGHEEGDIGRDVVHQTQVIKLRNSSAVLFSTQVS